MKNTLGPKCDTMAAMEANPKPRLKISGLPSSVKRCFPRGGLVDVRCVNKNLEQWRSGKKVEAEEPIEYFSMCESSGSNCSRGQKQTLKRFLMEQWVYKQMRDKQLELPYEEIKRLVEEGPKVYYAGSLLDNPKSYPRLKIMVSRLGLDWQKAEALQKRMKKADRAGVTNKYEYVLQALALANVYLGGYGVEGWKKGASFVRGSDLFEGLALLYVDMGNDSDVTLLFETDSELWLIGSPEEWLSSRGAEFGVGRH